MLRSVGVVAVLAAASGHAEDPGNPLLSEAKSLYRQLDYEACLARLRRAAKIPSTPADQVGIALYEGLCDFYLGRPSAAQAAFERALQLDPHARLPAFTSPKIENFFEQIVAAAPPPAVPAPAPVEPPPTEPPRAEPPTSLRAPDVPPPAVADLSARPPESQARHAHWLVPVLGSASVLSAGAGVVLGVEAKHWEGMANGASFESDGYRYSRAAKNSAVAANACYGVAATLVASAALTWWLQRD